MKLYDIAGEFCASLEDADKVYSLLSDSISSKNHVVISFEGVDVATTAFLNTSFGKAYKSFSLDALDEYVSLDAVSPRISTTLNLVKETALQKRVS